MWFADRAEGSFGELKSTQLGLCLEMAGRRMAVDTGYLAWG